MKMLIHYLNYRATVKRATTVFAAVMMIVSMQACQEEIVAPTNAEDTVHPAKVTVPDIKLTKVTVPDLKVSVSDVKVTVSDVKVQ